MAENRIEERSLIIERIGILKGRARRLCRAVWGRAAHPEGSPYRSEAEIVSEDLTHGHYGGLEKNRSIVFLKIANRQLEIENIAGTIHHEAIP
jgi:hypothetical protein